MSSHKIEDGGDFEVDTARFLVWLAEVGVRINPKMELIDLRKEGRGRGIGKQTPSH